MDFTELIKTVGLWPAIVLVLGWWIDRIRREQIARCEAGAAKREAELLAENKEYRDEARKTVEAKNGELAELRRIAMERARP